MLMPGFDENQFFRQATLRMTSSLNVEVAMQRLLRYLKQHMPVSGMLFALYDPDVVDHCLKLLEKTGGDFWR